MDSKDTVVIITFRRGKMGKSGQGQLGRGSKLVILKRVNRVVGRVELTCIFQKFFFFFLEIDAICQSFRSFSIVIKFSLVILLPITTKHLIPKFGATLVPTF